MTNGTALNGSDYDGFSTSLTFAPGETLKVVRVPILDNTGTEPTETFTVVLSDPVGLILPTTAPILTILDDDAGACVATTEVRVTEGTGSGGRTVTLFIDRRLHHRRANRNWSSTT
ncbi:MAG: hypothetical protein HC937_00560, partial [Aquincola sp.]|nr:hypothetical protein [Aquincola sp.]